MEPLTKQEIMVAAGLGVTPRALGMLPTRDDRIELLCLAWANARWASDATKDEYMNVIMNGTWGGGSAPQQVLQAAPALETVHVQTLTAAFECPKCEETRWVTMGLFALIDGQELGTPVTCPICKTEYTAFVDDAAL